MSWLKLVLTEYSVCVPDLTKFEAPDEGSNIGAIE